MSASGDGALVAGGPGISLVDLPVPPLPEGTLRLVITGFMGTGKTSVARAVAADLGMPVIDLDEVIVDRVGMPIAELVAAHGETALRERERQVLRQAARVSGAVIATGGGAVLADAEFAELARGALVVVLTADEATIEDRIGGDRARPMLQTAPLGHLMAERRERYAAAGVAVDTRARSISEVAAVVADLYRTRSAPEVLSFELAGARHGSRVLLGRGSLAKLAGAATTAVPSASRAIVASDGAVADTIGEAVVAQLRAAGLAVTLLPLPAGEQVKDVTHLTAMWEAMAAQRISRGDLVVAVGGGAALDAVGLAAATYNRGVPLVNLPTTVLAMVDAAIGGKVAIDVAHVKNLVGAFHHARVVVVDPQVAASLPAEIYTEGLAEAIKSLALASPVGLAIAEAQVDGQSLDGMFGWLVEQAVRIKAGYVSVDPFDTGVRTALNLGHTYAHALESASDYGLSHGQAVAIGCVAAARLGARHGTCRPDLAGRLAALTERIGLPVRRPDGLDRQRLIAAVGLDKKRMGGGVAFVVPTADGSGVLHGLDAGEALAELDAED